MLKSTLRFFSLSTARGNFARMQLYGTIGKIVARESKDNKQFLTYSLAVNRYTGPAEDRTHSTDWYNVSVFEDKQVAFFENYLGPGATLIVDADVTQKQIMDETGEHKQVYTSLKQKKFDVVRFPKKSEADLENS